MSPGCTHHFNIGAGSRVHSEYGVNTGRIQSVFSIFLGKTYVRIIARGRLVGAYLVHDSLGILIEDTKLNL